MKISTWKSSKEAHQAYEKLLSKYLKEKKAKKGLLVEAPVAPAAPAKTPAKTAAAPAKTAAAPAKTAAPVKPTSAPAKKDAAPAKKAAAPAKVAEPVKAAPAKTAPAKAEVKKGKKWLALNDKYCLEWILKNLISLQRVWI